MNAVTIVDQRRADVYCLGPDRRGCGAHDRPGRTPRSRCRRPGYDVSPGTLLPLLGAILALLGLEASAFWKGVR